MRLNGFHSSLFTLIFVFLFTFPISSAQALNKDTYLEITVPKGSFAASKLIFPASQYSFNSDLYRFGPYELTSESQVDFYNAYFNFGNPPEPSEGGNLNELQQQQPQNTTELPVTAQIRWVKGVLFLKVMPNAYPDGMDTRVKIVSPEGKGDNTNTYFGQEGDPVMIVTKGNVAKLVSGIFFQKELSSEYEEYTIEGPLRIRFKVEDDGLEEEACPPPGNGPKNPEPNEGDTEPAENNRTLPQGKATTLNPLWLR